MIKGDTQNFRTTELDYMENHPNRRAIAKGRKVPYHLQYVRDGKVNIKPQEGDQRMEVEK